MNAPDQRQMGLYNKFTVARNDGKDAPGQKHHGDAAASLPRAALRW